VDVADRDAVEVRVSEAPILDTTKPKVRPSAQRIGVDRATRPRRGGGVGGSDRRKVGSN